MGMEQQRKFSMEFKEQILREVTETGSVTLVAKKHGINSRNIYLWQSASKNSVQISEQRKVRELTKQVQEQALQIEVLKSLLKKTYQVWDNESKPRSSS
jgi:transposase-like protein